MARSGRTARVAAGRGASARTSASKAGPRARRAPSILAQRRRLELPRQDLWIELLAREMTLAPGLVDRLPARVPVTDPSGSVHGAMLRQEHSNWCWAAVAQCCAGVLKTAGRVRPQCLIANAVLQRADCCDTTGDDIDVVSTLPPALGAVGCRTAEIDGAAPFAEIISWTNAEVLLFSRTSVGATSVSAPAPGRRTNCELKR